MKLKYLPLVGALTMTAPAFAISVNMTDFSFTGPRDVTATDSATGFSFSGEAGRFNGTLADGASPAARFGPTASDASASASASFTAYCAELTQSFNFNVNYEYQWVSGDAYFGAARAANLSRLFTAADQAGFVVDSVTSSAMQAAIWEIIYETASSFNLLTGTFTSSPENPSYQTAFTTVNGFLLNLGSFGTNFKIEALTNATAQDFLVATPVPEPGTWALLVGGLGVVGLMARRRKTTT